MRNRCKFCKSTNCRMRIVTEGLEFDEIACSQHIRQLEKFADDVLGNPGIVRRHISSSSRLIRAKPVLPISIANLSDRYFTRG